MLTPSDLAVVVDKLAAFDAWSAGRPVTAVDALEPARIEALAAPEPRAALAALIAADSALTDEYNQITAVAKLVRMQRDFGRILRNFVNFSDFYSRQDGVFQNGTLPGACGCHRDTGRDHTAARRAGREAVTRVRRPDHARRRPLDPPPRACARARVVVILLAGCKRLSAGQ